MPESGRSSTYEGQLFENDDRPSIEEMEARRVAKGRLQHEHSLFKIEVSFSFGAKPEPQTPTAEARRSVVESDAAPTEPQTGVSPSVSCPEPEVQSQETPAGPSDGAAPQSLPIVDAAATQAGGTPVTVDAAIDEAQNPAITTPLQGSGNKYETQTGRAVEETETGEQMSEPAKIEGALSLDFWVPVRKEGEGEDMWRICTGYAVRGYPWTATIRSGKGNISVTGNENDQHASISLQLSRPDASFTAPATVPINITFPLPIASTWTTHGEILLATVFGSADWGTYTVKASRMRKDEFCKEHGFFADGQTFCWDYDDAASDGLVSAFAGPSYYLKSA